jgi:dipeptidyl aminopeptidase/acylaminoacyl peptidase
VQFDLPDGTATLTYDATFGELTGTVGTKTPATVHLMRTIRPVVIPIQTHDVSWKNGDVTLAGTVVTPAGPGPFPAIVWLHGRGKATRQGHRGLARIFAERGIASLIYDKRGAGESTGDHDTATILDVANDAIAGIEYLATRSDIDRTRIGLRANSAGAWAAPLVATRSKVPIAFVVTTVGPAESVREQQLHVLKYSMQQSGIAFTPEEYAAAKAHMELVISVAETGKGWDELRLSNARAKETRWEKYVDTPQSDAEEGMQFIRYKKYDPAPDLKRMKMPFLALYGGNDYVVPPQENVPKLERYLKEAGNTDFTIVVVPETGHALAYKDRVSHQALQTQIDWLLAHTKPSPSGRG